MTENEFIPLDTDRLAYETLAELNPALLRAIETALERGATAAQIAGILKHTYLSGTVIDLAIGAAHYLETKGGE